MLRIRPGALAVLVTAAGCGNPTFSAACDALVQGTHDLDTKEAPCGSYGHIVTRDECPEWVGPCTDSERAMIQAFGTCLSNLPTCSPETRATFNERNEACVTLILGLSSSCI
jgi:hypothetical protein